MFDSALRILALARKELLAILKDPRSRLSLLIPPILQCLIYGYAATYDLNNVPYAVLDQDHSAALGPGIAIGECTRFDTVFAFTRKDEDGNVHFYPYASLAECLSPVFGRKDSVDASGCAELR